MGAALVCNKLLQNPSNSMIKISMKIKTPSQTIENLPSNKPFWLSNWVRVNIARVAALFARASLSRPASTAAESVPTRKRHISLSCDRERPPKSSATDLPDDQQGLKLELKLQFCSLSSKWKVLSASKPLNKLCGVWIIFRSVKPADELFLGQLNLRKLRRVKELFHCPRPSWAKFQSNVQCNLLSLPPTATNISFYVSGYPENFPETLGYLYQYYK